MCASQQPPQNNQVTDDDLIRAVIEQCERAGVPVVPTKQVAQVDYIDVEQQTVKRRLDDIEDVNSIKVGRGKVWWVPEGDARGEIDMSSVYVKELDPKQLPTELVRKHPAGRPTGLYALADKGQQTLSLSLIVFFAGTILFLFRDVQWLPIPNGELELISAVGIVGGLAMMVVSAVIKVTALGIAKLDLSTPPTIYRINDIRNRLAEWLSTENSLSSSEKDD